MQSPTTEKQSADGSDTEAVKQVIDSLDTDVVKRAAQSVERKIKGE